MIIYINDKNKAGKRTKYFVSLLNGAKINANHPITIILFTLNNISAVQKLKFIAFD